MTKWFKRSKNNPFDYLVKQASSMLPNWIPGLGYNAPSSKTYTDRTKYEEYQKEQEVAKLLPWMQYVYKARDQAKYWEDYFKNCDGVGPNDIKYPWLKMGDTVSGSGFGVAYSTINFVSDNVKRLYR